MAERPLLSRFGRLPTYLVRAMKEAHAVIYAAIASVTWFILNLIGPSFLPQYFPNLGLPLALCGSVIIALVILGIAGYLVWEDEEHQHGGLKDDHATLQERLKPRLRIEFDPQAAKFVSPTRTRGGINVRYVRVCVRALSPVVRDCRAYLECLSYWDGLQYLPLFDEQLPMPWSYEDPRVFIPRELNHDVDALLDVAWLAEPHPELRPFGVLNIQSIVPLSFDPVALWIIQHPTNNLKLDVLVTATDSESARLSINIHRGVRDWTEAQVGWMEGTAIHIREANFERT